MCCDIILRVVLNNCYNLLSMQRCWCILIQKAVILSSLSIIFKTNLVSFTPVVARACETINFRSGCTVQTIDGVDVEVCYCDRALCNDSTHVTSPTVAWFSFSFKPLNVTITCSRQSVLFKRYHLIVNVTQREYIISRMTSIEIPFPSVVHVMLYCCHVQLYVHI